MNNGSLTQLFKGEWLEYIPTDWKQSKIKHLFSIKKNIAGELGHDVISITQRGAKLKDTESGEGQLSMDYSKYQLVTEGDFLMNHMDLLTGFVDISKFNGVTSPDYRVFTVSNDNAYSKYFLYLFQHGYKAKIFYAYGRGSSQLGRWRFPTVEFEDFYFPIPPIEEQKLISHYLDNKTSQIDSLVEKIQKKIDLLKEQRSSLINHFVTKGLDPNVEMKNSGVEWIGEIPRHWDVSKVGRHLKLERGRVISNIEIGDNPGPYPVYSSQTKNNGEMGLLSTYDFDGEYVSWTTDGANAGTCFRRLGKFNVTNVCGLLSSHGIEIDYQFLSFFLNTGTKGYVRQDINPKLMNDMMSEIPLLLVPLPEQKNIVSKIKQTTDRSDKIVELEEKRIKLLKSYRQSLISSVVTGKVRVTGDMI